MVDMRHKDILEDISRICPDIKDADGILNIDIGIFFDYSNQGIVTLGFGLITDDIEKDEDTEDDARYLFADTVLNHRYNHKGYITISRRSGRKVSKTGYPIAGPIEELNRYKMLMVMYGIRDKTITACFPINISLTKDDPIGGIELIIHDWELNSADKWGIDIRTNTVNKSSRVGIPQRYIAGQPRFAVALDNDLFLQPIQTGRDNLAGFAPAVNIIGQPKDIFFL